MSASDAYRLVDSDMELEGEPARNLATFVTTWMEPEAQQLIAENLYRNFIDHAEYPRTAEIERRCIRMLADLFHAPGDTTGARTQGSSEAVMLGALSQKWNWRTRQQAAGRATDRPNLVFGGDVHVVWEKFCRYFDVEPRVVPLQPGKYTIGPDDVEPHLDENTIGVAAVLGTTFTGHRDDLVGINELLLRIRTERDMDIPLHVDAASGGFVWPFLYPDSAWDFRLEQVRSINVSGHKFGLVYPGIGWLIFRERADLARDLVFEENYLGRTDETFTLNFSTGSAMVLAQYYNIVRFGRTGYRYLLEAMRHNAHRLADRLEEMGRFEIIGRDAEQLPLAAFRLRPGTSYDEFDVAWQLSAERGWMVPAYTLPPNAQDITIMRALAKNTLKDPESRLQNAIDRFALFGATGHRSYLLAAIEDILSLVSFDQAWPTPLLVLARELEALPEGIPLQVAYELRKRHSGRATDVLQYVLSGNLSGLYEVAAERALESREVDRKRLGGRSGVYLAEDPSGVVSDTFVFKPTLAALADREAERVAELERRLTQMGLSQRYSVPATLATSPLPDDDLLRANGCEVLVARRFHTGEILTNALDGKDLATRTSILDSVAKYLAVIHATECANGTSGYTSVRRELWRKDFGRWLKNGLRLPDSADVFDQWWKLFGTDPVLLPRRDAHPLNWLVGSDRSVIAVDFEACGWRPAGLELAQLLDDQPVLPVDDHGWKARLHLVRQYRRELARWGVAVAHPDLLRAWEAATVARAVGLLTSPKSDAGLRSHGEKLLDRISSRGSNPQVRELAHLLGQAWSVRRGVAVDEHDQLKSISDARRRHLSRAMAYELRHGSSVLLDPGGWAYVASVSDALYRSGLRTDSDEIRTVAAAIDEPRFELRGKKIRARYGHTRSVEIEYEPAVTRPVLFHGTSSHNLHSIFTDGEGLRTMGRQWVHLSSDPQMAIRTAERHGPGVLLAVDQEADCGQVFYAGGHVYLASEVPASSLRIVSPTEMFLVSGTAR